MVYDVTAYVSNNQIEVEYNGVVSKRLKEKAFELDNTQESFTFIVRAVNEGYSFNPKNLIKPDINPNEFLYAEYENRTYIQVYEENADVSYNANYTEMYITLYKETSTCLKYCLDRQYYADLNFSFKPSVDEQEPDRFVYITGTLSNCTCNYENGEVITSEKPFIIITANSGYEFDGNYSFMRDGVTEFFDNTGNTLFTEIKNTNSYYYLNDNYTATKARETISDFVRIYNPSEFDLTALSKIRFEVEDENIIDLGTFILALYKLPFAIPETELETGSNIVLGNIDTELKTTKVLTYNLRVDMGVIIVPEKYGNVYDYISTQCILHIPYFDKVYLSTEYVIGHEISIEYIIDLYTGNITANIYSTFINGIVQTLNGIIAYNIPFIQQSNNMVSNYVSNVNKNVIEKAFIEVVRNVPYNVDTVFGKPTVDYGKLSDYKGYIEVSEIVLNTTATADEKTEIIKLLNEGVFINE